MSPFLTGVVLFLFGALLTHLWSRYRTGLKRLRCSAQYGRLAVAGTDPMLGAVQVLYNGVAVTNLHLATIQVQNESASDVQSVAVNFACTDGSRILVSYGLFVGGLQYFPYTDDFNRVLNDTTLPNAATKREYLSRRRDFRIPVLNRGATANFVLLLLRNDAAQPNVVVACDHPGVQLVHEPAAPLIPLVLCVFQEPLSSRDSLLESWQQQFLHST